MFLRTVNNYFLIESWTSVFKFLCNVILHKLSLYFIKAYCLRPSQIVLKVNLIICNLICVSSTNEFLE